MVNSRRLDRAIQQYNDDHQVNGTCAPCIELGTAMFNSECWLEQEMLWSRMAGIPLDKEHVQAFRMAMKFAITVGMNLEKLNDQR